MSAIGAADAGAMDLASCSTAGFQPAVRDHSGGLTPPRSPPDYLTSYFLTENAVIGFLSPSGPEMIFIALIALLLFGKRLPEVARSLGKGMREFKEGMSGIHNEFESAYSSASRVESRPASRPAPPDDDRDEFAAPKFEPPPVATAESEPNESTKAN